jgi:hypothetical protein
MARKLRKQLDDLGLDIDEGDFLDLLSDTLLTFIRDMPNPVEQLERRPSLGIQFVGAVRHRLKNRDIPEEFIMRWIQNYRKRGNQAA